MTDDEARIVAAVGSAVKSGVAMGMSGEAIAFPVTVAGRLQLLFDLTHVPVVDDCGNVVGYDRIVDEDELMRILDMRKTL